ncbi:MAG TPA: hypothetical protein DEP84_06830 [Chloroflexi bacterium]|nr:hypothetical protein [Chloroflexota bacterium]
MNPGRVLVVVTLALLGLVFSPNVVLPQPSSSNACGDGRVDTIVDDFDSTAGMTFTADSTIPAPTLRLVAGCHGNALAIDYDLINVAPPGSPNAGQSWIVLRRSLPTARNLSAFTHLRLALHGSNLNSHDTVEVKLQDGAGHLFAVSLKSLTDLPVWRPIYIDFRELSGSGELDLTNITHFEIGIVRCSGCEVFDNPSLPGPPEEHTGTLFLDEFAVLDLKPGAANRLVETTFESVAPNPTIRVNAANALLAQIKSSGPGMSLVPAWFPETNSNFNTYVQAEALLVFIYEYEQTGNVAYRDAARNLAQKLLTLQIPIGKTNAGAWYTSYDQSLQPPTRPLPTMGQCDGTETMIQDIDTCEWVGNVGWVLIALGRLQQSGFYNDSAALNSALNRGADWVVGQFGRNSGFPNLISLGIEGNISAYFGLLASGRKQATEQLGQAIFQFGWDSVQRRMKTGVGPADTATALDVSGSWGAAFLCSIGKSQEALDSQSYAATVLRTSSFDGSTVGYGDIAGPFTVAVEFTAQAAVAGIKDADSVMHQIYPLQMLNEPYAGAFPGATDHWYGGALSPWSTTMSGASPTAWVYFASSYIDPLGGACRSKIYLPMILTGL